LTIFRIRRSTKDTFFPGLTTLSGTSWKFKLHVDSPCLGRRKPRLVDELAQPLLLQVARPPEGDAIVRPEAVERDTEELRRAVDDDHSDRAIADPKLKTLEEDAGSAGVVDQRLTVAQVLSQLLHCQVEVGVPAVFLDRVVVEPERIHGLRHPILVQDSVEAAPIERRALFETHPGHFAPGSSTGRAGARRHSLIRLRLFPHARGRPWAALSFRAQSPLSPWPA
jgi:hypothetical protein